MKEKVVRWLAWHMPRGLAYWTFIRVAVHAGSGAFSKELLPEITIVDAARRWDYQK